MGRIAIAALLALAACPIQPDNFGDAGPDGGGPTDAGAIGTVDAGTPASGTVSCVVGASVGGQSTQIVGSWAGGDLAGSAAAPSATSGENVQVAATNGSSGALTLIFEGLVPGTTVGALAGVSYQPPSGFAVNDNWSCSGDCNFQVPTFSFDGVHVSGTFQGTFFANQSASQGTTCSLTSGSFAVTLPQ